ncbi:MAG: glycosyltransferase family 39 protein [Bacteroidetes bacterium]|nr:glycosyltransferase family 39 protein [Bacteroidota bacterium]
MMLELVEKRIRQFPTQLILVVIGAILFLPFLGKVHLFGLDEISFAESAREMLASRNFHVIQFDFIPYFGKPPLFIWLQALSMHYFGVNEFAARLPNAIVGIATMLVVFNIGRYVFNSRLGVLWALFFACSILPQVQFKSGIIDPAFNLFTFLGIFFMYKLNIINEFEDRKTRKKNRRRNLLFSALFIGLATLTKGPVAILICLLTASAYIFANRGKMKIELTELFFWGILISIIGIAWLLLDTSMNGFAFVMQFLRYQVRWFSTGEAGEGGPFFYHIPLLLIGVFPASALIFSTFTRNVYDDLSEHIFRKWMIYFLIVVLILCSLTPARIVHYSSVCYFSITFLAAYYLNLLFDGKATWRWKQTVPLMGIGILIVGALTAAIFIIKSPEPFLPYIQDDFAKEALKTPVYWSDWDIRFGLIYLFCLVVSILLMQSKNVRWGAYLLLISSGLFINTVMIFIVPRVEKYTQAALIEFIQTKQNEACTIEPVGFKTYAHLFYALKPAPEKQVSSKKNYFITKVNTVPEVLQTHPAAHELYRKNGWVFFVGE